MGSIIGVYKSFALEKFIGVNCKELLINAVIGGMLGLYLMKFCKSLAFTIGLLAILIEILRQFDSMNVTWINKILVKFESQLSLSKEKLEFLQEKWNARGFSGGFLIGMSMS